MGSTRFDDHGYWSVDQPELQGVPLFPLDGPTASGTLDRNQAGKSTKMMNGAFSAVVVDDDRLVLSSLRRVLGTIPNCRTKTFLKSRTAVDFLNTNQADLLVTDYVMPELDGLGLISQVCPRHPDMAVLLMSGFATLEMMRAACRLGATDVLFKPIAAEEFLDSVHLALEKRNAAIQRRSLIAYARQAMDILSTSPAASPAAVRPPDFLQRDSLALDLASNQFSFNGRTLDLTGCEHLIMEILMLRRGQLVTHSEIWQHVTGMDEPKKVASELLRGHVTRLRRKIEEDPSRPRFLRSVWGKGYVLSLEAGSLEPWMREQRSNRSQA